MCIRDRSCTHEIKNQGVVGTSSSPVLFGVYRWDFFCCEQQNSHRGGIVAGHFWVFLFLTVWGIYIFYFFHFGRACQKVMKIIVQRYFPCNRTMLRNSGNKAIRSCYCVTQRAKNLPPSKFSEIRTCVAAHIRNCTTTSTSDALD